MRFVETALPGAYLIEPERLTDDRGFFARTWCREEFAARGLAADLSQCSVSSNTRRGTLRGMHYQVAPHAETKVVRCTRGAIFDVIIDLRPASGTYRRWFGVELRADNYAALYVPEGFAHGFLTLANQTDVSYQMSAPYAANAARGVRWDDPAFAVVWPFTPQIIATRDQTFANFRDGH